jgi:5-methylcytosine-specific restriction enzyme A
MPRALTVCSVPGCPQLTPAGRCVDHAREADRARGTAHQRGYGSRHRRVFRRAVLRRDPVCVLCHQAPATTADHYPLSRRELEARGLDPDDPRFGRGLCQRCHSRETARNQPGGWNT